MACAAIAKRARWVGKLFEKSFRPIWDSPPTLSTWMAGPHDRRLCGRVIRAGDRWTDFYWLQYPLRSATSDDRSQLAVWTKRNAP